MTASAPGGAVQPESDPNPVLSPIEALWGTLLVVSLGCMAVPWLACLWLLGLFCVAWLWGRKRGQSWWQRLDALFYAGESTIVAAAMAVMVSAVFIDVVWRTLHATDEAGRMLVVLIWSAACVLAAATRRSQNSSLAKRAYWCLAAIAVGTAGGWLIHAAPNGFGWSQRLALVLMMWVGMLGISMADYAGRHLQLEALSRWVPPRFQWHFAAARSASTIALLLFLAHHASGYLRDNWDEWLETEGSAGVFESLPIPYWVASQPIATAFALMVLRQAARFLASFRTRRAP